MRDNETKLAELRLDHNLHQKDIANKLKIKEDTYSKWERGINDIPLSKSNEIANIFDVSMDYLLELSDKNIVTERKNIDYKLLCNRLIELRKECNLSQEKLSKEIGFHQRTYAHYENGSSIPTTYKLYYIVQFYDVSFDYIVGRTDKKKIE